HDPEATRIAYFRRLYERLRDELPRYEFYETFTPFHSSYDDWHIFGRRRARKEAARKASTSSTSRPNSTRTHSDFDQSADEESAKEKDLYVVARVSTHHLRLEREFKLVRELEGSEGALRHIPRTIEFGRLPTRRDGEHHLSYAITEAAGPNYLRDLVEFGPNYYLGSPNSPQTRRTRQVPLLTFLDFACMVSYVVMPSITTRKPET
ncbi:hypothetical protein KC352_g45280, partial [Hortaea werneckii]